MLHAVASLSNIAEANFTPARGGEPLQAPVSHETRGRNVVRQCRPHSSFSFTLEARLLPMPEGRGFRRDESDERNRSGAQACPMVDRGKCAGSGTGCPGMGPDRRGPAAGPVHPRGGTGCARRARRLRRPPRGLEGYRPLQDAQRDLARGDARGHSQPGCRPGLSRRARGAANRQGARCPALAPPESRFCRRLLAEPPTSAAEGRGRRDSRGRGQ